MHHKRFRVCCLLLCFALALQLLPVRSMASQDGIAGFRCNSEYTQPPEEEKDGSSSPEQGVFSLIPYMVSLVASVAKFVLSAQGGDIQLPEKPLLVIPGAFQMRYSDPDSRDYLDYCVFFPENATQNMPLIVYLHGDGTVGKPEELVTNPLYRSAEACYGDDFPFVLLAPCTRQKSWIADDIPQTLAGLIDFAVEKYHCSKVILVGYSRGAIGGWYMIEKFPERFAGAVLVSCRTPWEWEGKAAAAVPVRAFAGDTGEDENYYALRMRQAVELLQENGGDAQLTILAGNSHGSISSVVYSKELFAWMIAQ